MLMSIEDCMPMLRCPATRSKLRVVGDAMVADSRTTGGASTYPIAGGMPILVDYSKSVLCREKVVADAAQSVIHRPSYRGPLSYVKKLLSPEKPASKRNLEKFVSLIEVRSKKPKLLVVGGGSIGRGMRYVYGRPSLDIVAFDIYASPNVQFIADAHQIPIEDESFDAVIVQAVLEHVLQPAEVVSEIWRVLKPGGIVYAETPFMQQVHEGPYDFTRFTESGHRYLFRRFEMVSSGASGGPGLQFMWSVDYLFRSVFRSVRIGKMAKLLFFWTQYLDAFIPSEFAVDAASGVYFLGTKSNSEISAHDIVEFYKGAQ